MGTYNDYLDGEVDGETHWDEAQMDRDGEMIVHGKEPVIPYMVPTVSFANILLNAYVQLLILAWRRSIWRSLNSG